MTLKLDRNLHPTAIVAAFLSNPGRDLTLDELRALLPEVPDVATGMSRLTARGHATRVGSRLYRLGNVPSAEHSCKALKGYTPGRPLSLDLTLHPNPIIAAFLSNPAVPMKTIDLRYLLPEIRRLPKRVALLATSGHLTRVPGETTWSEYTLAQAPHPVRSGTGMQRARNGSSAQRTRRTPASEKRVRIALTDEQKDTLAAEKKARQEDERRRLTAQIAREDSAKFLAALEGAPDGLAEAQIVAATGLTRGRIAQVMRHLRDDGKIRVTRQHTADVYQLTRLDLPERPARMTPAARLVEAHLSTRAGDTIPYMVGELRLSRQVIRDALGTLRALGRLEWKFFDHLPVFRLARQEVRNAAD